MLKRLAFISEHASPMTSPGGVDCGGQNIFVGEFAKHLAARGYSIDIFTRRDNRQLPEVAEWVPGVRLIHVPAGPAKFVRKEDMLPLMDEFTGWVLAFCETNPPYDLIHAHFWMSGMVA